MRKGCRASKYEKKCSYYDYGLGRCVHGKVPATCKFINQEKFKTKKEQAEFTRKFYHYFGVDLSK